MVSDFSTSFISDALKSRRADSPAPSRAGALEKADAVLVQHHLLDGKVGGQRDGDAEDQADRNGKFHSFSNGGMPWSADPFRRASLTHCFNNDAFRTLAVELRVIDLLPRAEIQLARGTGTITS